MAKTARLDMLRTVIVWLVGSECTPRATAGCGCSPSTPTLERGRAPARHAQCGSHLV